jgi:hypothetical protein
MQKSAKLKPLGRQKRKLRHLTRLPNAEASREEEEEDEGKDTEASGATEQEVEQQQPTTDLRLKAEASGATEQEVEQQQPTTDLRLKAEASGATEQQEKLNLLPSAPVAAIQTPYQSQPLPHAIQANRIKPKNIDFSYKRRTKNIIGFHSDYSTSYNNVLEDTDNLGTTTSFYKIFYSEGNENPNNITNILKNISENELNIDIDDMLLTKIAEEKKADITHLFSIKLKTNNIKGKTNIFNYPSQSLNVEIYILLMNDNKIDFKNMYKNQNHITYLPCENLKYILFLGKFDTSEEWTKTDSSEKTIMKSLNFEKVLFIYSKHPTIPGRLLPFTNNKINLKQPINIVDYNTEFSKEVLFSLYNIDFITFTEEHFDKMIENKQHGGCCGVNNEIDDVVDSIEDVKDVKEDVKIGGDKVVKKKVKNKLPKKGKKSTKIADIES